MLYVVSTPIGNLEDLSFRAARIILKTPIILAEDTRSFAKLKNKALGLFGIDKANLPPQKIISYYKEVELKKLPKILGLLKEGKDIALVSEAGTPIISDPGFMLTKAAYQEGIKVEFVPGPTAFVQAALFSNFEFKEIIFLGYFPKKKRRRFLKKIEEGSKIFESPIFVFYESPHRIKDTARLIWEYFKGKINCCLCREMTKRFEERIIVNSQEDLKKLKEKGEYTVVLKY